MTNVANETLKALEAAILRDGGATFRKLQREEFLKLTDAFDPTVSTNLRKHLGASLIGKQCARELWYSFHWVKVPTHAAQLLRLFNRGHLEEARFIALLKAAGLQVWSESPEGKQFKVQGCDGHFGGSIDSVVLGIPEAPDTPYLAEFKTHSTKSFTNLKSNGVKEAKWEHYVQMQIYMGGLALAGALYLAVNKDTDEIYAEIVAFDNETYSRYMQRASSIISSDEPPSRMHGSSPTWFQCKYCTYYTMCHYFELPIENCRTCSHSTPAKEGRWECIKGQSITNFERCDKYIWNPSILNEVEVIAANEEENWIQLKTKDGTILDSRT